MAEKFATQEEGLVACGQYLPAELMTKIEASGVSFDYAALATLINEDGIATALRVLRIFGFTIALLLALFAGCGTARAKPIEVKGKDGKVKTYFTGRKVDPAKLAVIKHKARLRNGWRSMPHVSAPTWDAALLGIVGPTKDQGQCGSCFKPGVMIRMEDGSEKPIEQVKIGDRVLSAEGNVERVHFTSKRHVRERLMTLIGHAHLTATMNHPILTQRGYVRLCNVRHGDYVYLTPPKNRGPPRQIYVGAVIDGELYDGDVFNLNVGGDHSYLANGIGVHNCWDFSGTEVVESALYKAGQLKNDGTPANMLSCQYTLDCGQNGGCNGDDNTTVLDWAKKTGIPTDAEYGPYTASSGRCKTVTTLYKLADWGFADGGQGSGVTSVQQIKDAIAAHGRVGCGIDASVLGDGTGIVSGGGHSIDHDVVIDGWDDTKGKAGCWIMNNSWGKGWGITINGVPGRCYIEYGSGDVGTETVWATATPITPPVGAPVVNSPTSFSCGLGVACQYRITATNTPTSFDAAGLPPGFAVDKTTGIISGTATTTGTYIVTVAAINTGGTGSETVTTTLGTPVPPVPPGPGPGPGPGPSVTITIALTADQQAALLAQLEASTGGSFISGDMSYREVMRKLQKCVDAKPRGIKLEVKPPCPCKTTEPPVAPKPMSWVPSGKDPHRCTCGCETTGQCMCPNCSVGCGFLVKGQAAGGYKPVPVDNPDKARLDKLEKSNEEIRKALTSIMNRMADVLEKKGKS